jgi:hypothetical protein
MSLIDDLRTGHMIRDAQSCHAGAHLLSDGHLACDTQSSAAVGDPSRTGHARYDTQVIAAGAHLLPDGHSEAATQWQTAVGDPSPTIRATTIGSILIDGPSLGWLELRTWAELFEDAQAARVSGDNRARATGVPEVYAAHIAALARMEHECKLALRATFRRVVPEPIKQWQKDTPGIGLHFLARLLGHLGDPAVATPHHWEGTGDKRKLVADEPYRRTLSQLWQLCGHGDPSRRIRKGMTAAELAAVGNPTLKMVVHLNAKATMMCIGSDRSRRSPFRDVYDARRLVTADRVHAAPCVRCGPKGHPAPEGSPWSLAHQNADALRVVGKEILRDLWKVSQ